MTYPTKRLFVFLLFFSARRPGTAQVKLILHVQVRYNSVPKSIMVGRLNVFGAFSTNGVNLESTSDASVQFICCSAPGF